MKWMNFAGDGGGRIRPFAGIYLRTPRRTRFWGWGEYTAQAAAAAANAAVAGSAAETNERPWAALGDWLRAAHAMFGPEDPKQAEAAAGASCFTHGEGAADRRQTVGKDEAGKRKRRLRFVCNRRAIGLIFE